MVVGRPTVDTPSNRPRLNPSPHGAAKPLTVLFDSVDYERLDKTAARSISSRQARLAWEALQLLPIVLQPLSDDLPRVVGIAFALKQQRAYDAA